MSVLTADKTCTKCQVTKSSTEFYRGATCRDCWNTYLREYRSVHGQGDAATIKKRHMKNRYGLTMERYKEMLAAQSFACAICGAEASSDRNKGGSYLHVDHDHNTNQVRGLLCHKCNVGIGMLEDNPEFLAAAITYLYRDE